MYVMVTLLGCLNAFLCALHSYSVILLGLLCVVFCFTGLFAMLSNKSVYVIVSSRHFVLFMFAVPCKLAVLCFMG